MHVYPHPNLPLLPRVLSQALHSEIYLTRGGAPIPVDKLTSQAWCTELSLQERENLALQVSKAVQKVCYGRSKKASWNLSALNVAPSIALSDLKLTDRALVSLQKHEFFQDSGAWRKSTVSEMMGEKDHHRIGARLLLAILLAIENSPQDGDSKSKHRARFESAVFNDVKRLIHSPRVARIFIETNGWSGSGKKSLSDIADDLGITHERTRQLNVLAHQSIEEAGEAPGISAALKSIHTSLSSKMPLMVEKAQDILVDEGVCTEMTQAVDVYKAAEIFNISIPSKITEIDGQLFIVQEGQDLMIKMCRALIRRSLRATGILEISYIDQEIRAGYENAFGQSQWRHDFGRISQIAYTTMPGWSYLEQGNRWATVTLGTDGQELFPRGPAAKIAKMAWFYKDISLSQAKAVLDLQGVVWPASVLLSLCLRMGIHVQPTKDDWVLSIVPDVAEKIESMLAKTAELQMAKILQSEGGNLSRSVFIKKCEATGIHRSTILACLKSSSLFVCMESSECMLSTNAQIKTLVQDKGSLNA